MRPWLVAAALLCACARGNPDLVEGADLATAQPDPEETCGDTSTCGTRGNVVLCNRGAGADCRARYLVSDGTSFACASCTDCTAGQINLASWCGGITTSGGTTTGGTTVLDLATIGNDLATIGNDMTTGGARCDQLAKNDCLYCCIDQHPDGRAYQEQLRKPCLCVSPGECKADCSTAGDYCDSGKITTQRCYDCVSWELSVASGGSCGWTRSRCAEDPECAALVACGEGCQ